VQQKIELKSGLILLADDLADELWLTKSALFQARIYNETQVTRSGHEAIAYLEGSGRFSDRDKFCFPDLLLLDLKMPGMDGFQVLDWIRANPDYGSLPVIVVSASDDPED